MPFFNKPAKPKPAGIVSSIEAFIRLMNDLIALLDQEVEYVGGRKLAEHEQLLKRKQRMTMDYRASLKSITPQTEALKQLPEKLLAALRMTAEKLAAAIERNAKCLRVTITATQRLIQNIISIVKQEALTKPGYRNHKTAHLQLGTYSPLCKPIAVSRTA